MATIADFEKEFLDKANAGTYATYQQMLKDDEKTKADKQASTQKYITGQGEIIDRATDNSVKKVQEQIDAAPGEYQNLFDRNALSEMVGRHAAEVKMANMGMSDSGLNRSTQAALSARRMNADADARKSMREYVNGLETAITDITVAGESQKQQIALDANKSMDDWFTQLDAQTRSYLTSGLDANRQNSYTYGADMWNAQQENAATVEAAKIKAAADTEAAKAQAAKDANNLLIDLMDKGGMTYEEASAAVFGGSAQTAEAQHDAQIAKAVGAITEEEYNIAGWNTFWSTPAGDGEEVYKQIVRDKLQKTPEYASLTAAGRLEATAEAIGKAVAMTWEPDGDNGNRIDYALYEYLAPMFGYNSAEEFKTEYPTILEQSDIFLDMKALAMHAYGQYRQGY